MRCGDGVSSFLLCWEDLSHELGAVVAVADGRASERAGAAGKAKAEPFFVVVVSAASLPLGAQETNQEPLFLPGVSIQTVKCTRNV